MALPRERVLVCDNGSGVRGPATHCFVPARRRRSSPTPLTSRPPCFLEAGGRLRMEGGFTQEAASCAGDCARALYICVCRVMCGTGLPSTGNAICNLCGGQEPPYSLVLWDYRKHADSVFALLGLPSTALMCSACICTAPKAKTLGISHRAASRANLSEPLCRWAVNAPLVSVQTAVAVSGLSLGHRTTTHESVWGSASGTGAVR